VGDTRGVYRVFVRRPNGKRALARHRHKREDNIKVDVQEVEWDGLDWTDLA
jgi:hypothetical protein